MKIFSFEWYFKYNDQFHITKWTLMWSILFLCGFFPPSYKWNASYQIMLSRFWSILIHTPFCTILILILKVNVKIMKKFWWKYYKDALRADYLINYAFIIVLNQENYDATSLCCWKGHSATQLS